MGYEIDRTPLRTRVYVDGFNLYYGCLKRTPYKWLDLLALFEDHVLPSSVPCLRSGGRGFSLLPLGIKFFTAKIVENAARSVDSVACQMRYHTALRKRYPQRIALIEGYYSLTQTKARQVDETRRSRLPRDCEEVLVWKLEEKQSDVNLALHAYHDAITGEVEQIVVVSNDTDLTPALDMVRRHTDVRIGLVVPSRDPRRTPNTELAELSHWTRNHIADAELAAAQLPRVIPGRRVTIKPLSWFERPDLVERAVAMTAEVTGGRGAAFQWLEAPHLELDGSRPIDLLGNDADAIRVFEAIAAMAVRRLPESRPTRHSGDAA